MTLEEWERWSIWGGGAAHCRARCSFPKAPIVGWMANWQVSCCFRSWKDSVRVVVCSSRTELLLLTRWNKMSDTVSCSFCVTVQSSWDRTPSSLINTLQSECQQWQLIKHIAAATREQRFVTNVLAALQSVCSLPYAVNQVIHADICSEHLFAGSYLG
jgi:hypothetical protein